MFSWILKTLLRDRLPVSKSHRKDYMQSYFTNVIEPELKKLNGLLGIKTIDVVDKSEESKAPYKWASYGSTKTYGVQFELSSGSDDYEFDGGDDEFRSEDR